MMYLGLGLKSQFSYSNFTSWMKYPSIKSDCMPFPVNVYQDPKTTPAKCR